MDRRFAFYELAKHFLQSYNPKCYREVVILNCILDYDGPLPEDGPMRHFAHEFVNLAYIMIEMQYKNGNLIEQGKKQPFFEWIDNWVRNNT